MHERFFFVLVYIKKNTIFILKKIRKINILVHLNILCTFLISLVYSVRIYMYTIYGIINFSLSKGFPIIPAITYAVARGLFFNDK